MLELALHLESKVIQLKQDALRLMNIALAETACGQLLLYLNLLLDILKAKSPRRGQSNWKS